MIKNYLEKISSGENLTITEAYEVMVNIMNGECNNSQIAGLLLALRTKGETAEEVAGFTRAMRFMSTKISCSDNNAIDVCGTGGDCSNTFNISTAASFVVAGAGIKVAKHGNRSISSKSGSADVLIELGININLTPAQSEEALNEIGIAFLFAPIYHPAMKFAAGVRKELGIKTIFNILGPLTNPAGTKRQLIGTYNNKAALLMANAAFHLDMDKVSFICTADSYDEISLTHPTSVYEYSRGQELNCYELTSGSFGYNSIDINKIKSDSAANNALIILSVLRDKIKNEAFYVVAANAALAIYTSGHSATLLEARMAAEESILSGNAYNKLYRLRLFGERFS
jgi:anthranilate phosphoribosyltransferase